MHFNVLTLYGVALAARGVQAEMSANQLVDSFSAFTETSNKIIGTSENIDASMVEDAIPVCYPGGGEDWMNQSCG